MATGGEQREASMRFAARPALVGRELELRAVRQFLEPDEPSRALLVSGRPGIGKTTLWQAALAAAAERGMAVLAARPRAAEAKLSLGALSDLLDSVDAAVLERLPPFQRRALEVALLRAEPDGRLPEPRTLAAALLNVVRSLASERPVLVAVDDVQWLDAASDDALAFAARRLEPAGVRFLFTIRTGESCAVVRAFEPARPLRMALGGLSLGATRRLLAARLELTPPRRELIRLHEATQGNPLFALEIGRVLAERAAATADEPLPVPEDVSSVVRGGVAGLADATREVLLAAALLAEPSAETLRAVLGRPFEADLEPAERAGVARLDGGAVVFSHPLHAGAVVAAAPAAERRRMHRRLAGVVERLEERARHLALAVEGRDEAAARTIHAAARDALRRGLPRTAAELGELAVEVGEPASRERPHRLVDLAAFLRRAAEPARARDLLAGIDDWSGWPSSLEARARGQLLLAAYWTDGPLAAVERGERMLEESLCDEARAAVHAHLSGCCEFDLDRAAAHGERALAVLDSLGDAADPGVLLHALAMRVRNGVVLGHGLDRELVERVRELEDVLPPERWQSERMTPHLSILFKHVDDLDASREHLQAHLAYAVDAHDEVTRMVTLTHLALTECWAGDFAAARRYLDATAPLVDDVGVRNVGLLTARALVEAHVGDADAVHSIAATLVGEHGDPGVEVWGLYLGAALGLAELSAGDDGAADERFRALLRALDRGGHREPGIYRAHGNAAEAAIAVGDVERAEAIADELDRHARDTGHRWSRATGARTRALIAAVRGDHEQAVEHAEHALGEHEHLAMAYERARTLLVYGVVQRRGKRRARARVALEEAAAEFERMGVRPWARRARGEVERVSGRRARSGELTQAEQRVVELAARGLSNKQIAQAQFVTVHTVELHLSRAYAKLGVRSRTQLADRLARAKD